MGVDKTGQIVWHDLFTGDRARAMAFYTALANWSYVTEHATEFAWGSGEAAYVLALLENEAGAGLIDAPPGMRPGWIGYVEVRDVDAAADLAVELGGTVLRAPFDVPGVGRNALLSDPLGARIGVALSRHDYPVPMRQFGAEMYLSDQPFPDRFYARLFGWDAGAEPAGQIANPPSKTQVAMHLIRPPLADGPACWVPSIKLRKPAEAAGQLEALGGTALGALIPDECDDSRLLIADCDGVVMALQAA